MKRIALIMMLLLAAVTARPFSLDLDSVAQWGRFPRFCVDTYRWGADFLNGFDTTYVHGTDYPFNVKVRTESWTDYYNIRFDNQSEMSMISDPSTSVGLYLTYLAVSAGYDMNVSKYLGGSDAVRRRWNFGFNCMLFTTNVYFVSNDVGTRVSRFKPYGANAVRPGLAFNGIDNVEWGIDVSYFINHKRYSAAAAYNFSRVQVKSGGSFFVGFCYDRQNYHFNFASLPGSITSALPPELDNMTYQLRTRNYMLKGGYGYNWVFRPRWVLGVSESPMLGISRGYISTPSEPKSTFALLSTTKLSVVYNNGRWFAGAIGTLQAGLARDSQRSLLSSYITLDLSLGYRFALW